MIFLEKSRSASKKRSAVALMPRSLTVEYFSQLWYENFFLDKKSLAFYTHHEIFGLVFSLR